MEFGNWKRLERRTRFESEEGICPKLPGHSQLALQQVSKRGGLTRGGGEGRTPSPRTLTSFRLIPHISGTEVCPFTDCGSGNEAFAPATQPVNYLSLHSEKARHPPLSSTKTMNIPLFVSVSQRPRATQPKIWFLASYFSCLGRSTRRLAIKCPA